MLDREIDEQRLLKHKHVMERVSLWPPLRQGLSEGKI